MEKIGKEFFMIHTPNPDERQYVSILVEISENNGYCLTKAEHNEDTLCPCKIFREKGFCDCGRFIGTPHNYPIVTLCGSTRFKDDFIHAQKILTLNGYIVISVGMFGHSGDQEVWHPGVKEMLDEIHKQKIDMADSIVVIDTDNYIGNSTKSEIKYAQLHNKPILYWSEIKEEMMNAVI